MANGRERRDGIGPRDKVAACFVGREGQRKKKKKTQGWLMLHVGATDNK